MLAVQKTRNVLLAEDDDEDYLIFTLAVEDTKLSVKMSRAENGEELMNALQVALPDILFLDILMPCKDGKQCLKEIRANRAYDELPIMMYTAFNDAANVEFCFREGGNHYIVKPNSIAELTEIIRRILVIDWKGLRYYPPRSEFVINPFI